jgi:hypothetical protein
VSFWGHEYDQCAPSGNCGNESVEAQCDGPNDCPPSWLCCGRYGGQGYVEVLCSQSCEDDGTTQGVVLCDTQADCPAGLCTPSGWLPTGFSFCAQ